MRIDKTAAILTTLIVMAACAGDNIDRSAMYTTDTSLSPPPQMVEYTFGSPVLTHMTCSDITGKPEQRNWLASRSQTGGNGLKMSEADYHRLVAAGDTKADRWKWDRSHPAYGRGC